MRTIQLKVKIMNRYLTVLSAENFTPPMHCNNGDPQASQNLVIFEIDSLNFSVFISQTIGYSGLSETRCVGNASLNDEKDIIL